MVHAHTYINVDSTDIHTHVSKYMHTHIWPYKHTQTSTRKQTHLDMKYEGDRFCGTDQDLSPARDFFIDIHMTPLARN